MGKSTQSVGATGTNKSRERMMSATEANGLIRGCPQPDAARAALQAAILSEAIKIESRTAFYRQKGGNVQPAQGAILIDRKMWVRIEKDGQIDKVWMANSANLGATGGGAVDLHDIVIDRQAVTVLVKSMGGDRQAKTNSNAGAPTRRHGTTIDFVIRYLRALPEGHALAMKNDTIAVLLDCAYVHLGGLSLGARGLKDLSAEVKGALRTPHVDPKLTEMLDKIAGIKRN